MTFGDALRSPAQLRGLYPEPSKPSVAKQIDHLDRHCRALIGHSPFVVVATADDAGRCDVSPKGGPPGFVKVLDEHRLGLPDLSGNNRLDSMQNLVSNSGIALLFIVPGLDETLRVNGQAAITTAPEVLDACTVAGVRPRVALGVTAEEVFIHCGKALRRADLWKPDAWPDLTDLPSVACMLRDHYALPDMDLDAVEHRLAESYGTTMWLAGGAERAPITGAITGD